jgi:hypothetical protein
VRIDSLPHNNRQTQGAQRREWLRQHSPQHLEQSASLMLRALRQRPYSAPHNVLTLGAGACTEIPLVELTRASDEVVLADIDRVSMQQARDALPSNALHKRVRVLNCDLSGGVSASLNHLLEKQPWDRLMPQGAQSVFNVAAQCLEQCPVPDPPEISGLATGEFGLVISSLVLSQLFSYPLLDVLDYVQRIAPDYLGEQERHRRYQEAAQAFRIRVIQAHLHLLHELVDADGLIVLLSDVRGFVFDVYGTDHDAEHRRTMPLVPHTFPDLVRGCFTLVEEADWEWLTDLPTKGRPGRGYEVVGYMLKPSK